MSKLIAIVGMSGSGKSMASDYLEKKGYNRIYFGGVVVDKVIEEGLEVNQTNEKMIREGLRKKYGMAAIAIILLPKIEESIKVQDTVIDGLYSWDELLILKEKYRNNLKIICINCDKDIRYERIGKRKVRPIDRETIEKRDIAEIENLAKGGPIAFADYYLDNNGSIEEYYKKLELILEKIENRGV